MLGFWTFVGIEFVAPLGSMTVAFAAVSLLGLCDAFLGAHAIFLPKAGIIVAVSLVAAAVTVLAAGTTDDVVDVTDPHEIDLTEGPAPAAATPRR